MIEFYGDSFSAVTHGWPSMLATRLSQEVSNHSITASSITETISLLRDKDSFSDIVCVTISSPDRIYHPDYLIHTSLGSNKPSLIHRGLTNPANSELQTAIKYYYAYLENDVNRIIRYECQFNWLLNLTNKHPNTKFVLIPCFENSNILYEQFNAIITSPLLVDVWKINNRNIPDINHMTMKQNKQFADQLYELLLNYDANKSKTVEISFK